MRTNDLHDPPTHHEPLDISPPARTASRAPQKMSSVRFAFSAFSMSRSVCQTVPSTRGTFAKSRRMNLLPEPEVTRDGRAEHKRCIKSVFSNLVYTTAFYKYTGSVLKVSHCTLFHPPAILLLRCAAGAGSTSAAAGLSPGSRPAPASAARRCRRTAFRCTCTGVQGCLRNASALKRDRLLAKRLSKQDVVAGSNISVSWATIGSYDVLCLASRHWTFLRFPWHPS